MEKESTVVISRSGFDRFCEEVFKNLNPDQRNEILNKNLLTPIKKVLEDSVLYDSIKAFFANNLNFAETSRVAYIHRNTLIYRLEKIYKLTGLDLRNFEDAVCFRLYIWLNEEGRNVFV